MIIEKTDYFIKLIAEEGKLIISYDSYLDEESGAEVPYIKGTEVYLGKDDSPDNYYEIEKE